MVPVTNGEGICVVDPLQIHDILRNIFFRLKVGDQKEFRLVNIIWRNSTLVDWRKTALVSIGNFKDVVEGFDVYEYGELQWKKFFEMLEGGENEVYRIGEIPFRNFRVSCSLLDFDNESTGGAKFVRLCGKSIELLELEYCRCSGSYLKFVRRLLLEKCLKLQELSLSIVTFHNLEENWRDNMISDNTNTSQLKSLKLVQIRYPVYVEAMQLFQIIPNLEKLCLGLSHGATVDFLKALANSNRPGNHHHGDLIKIKDLEVKIGFDHNIFPLILEYLEAARPPLKKVKYENCFLPELRAPPFCLKQFFGLCKENLTSLQLRFDRCNEEWITDFSGFIFPQLTNFNLIIDEAHKVRKNEKFVKFDFFGLCGMPQLKTFSCESNSFEVASEGMGLHESDLKYEGWDEWMGEDMNDGEYSSLELEHLEEFNFQMPDRIGVDGLERLSKILGKKLRKLGLVVNDDTLEVVGSYWPNVEVLRLVKGSTVGMEAYKKMKRENPSIRILIPKEGLSSTKKWRKRKPKPVPFTMMSNELVKEKDLETPFFILWGLLVLAVLIYEYLKG